jgi:hypothetical protein
VETPSLPVAATTTAPRDHA